MPRVSIGMPVHNGERHLAQALASLLAQDFEDFELIISDNASSDHAGEICREFAKRDKRIRCYRNETNLGAAANYNRVFELSSAAYFKWAAHDDLCAPSYLRRCVEILDSTPSAVLCYAKTTLIDDDGAVLRSYDDNLDIRCGSPSERLRRLLRNLVLCNVLEGVIRSDALRSTGLIGSYGGADVVLLAELALQGAFREIPEPLFFRRMGPGPIGRAHEVPKHKQANETCEQVSAWFDPRRRAGSALPCMRRLMEHLRAIHRSSLSWLDKAACYEVVLEERFTNGHQWRVLGGELKKAVRRKLGRAGMARGGFALPASGAKD